MISTQSTSASLQSILTYQINFPLSHGGIKVSRIFGPRPSLFQTTPPPPPPPPTLPPLFYTPPPPPSPSVYSSSPPIRQGTQEYCPYWYFSLGNITLVLLSQKKIIMDKTTYFRLSFNFHLLDIRTTYTFANINCFWTVKVNAHVIMETDSDVQRKSLSSKKFWT